MIKHGVIFGPGYEDDRIEHLRKCASIPARRKVKVDLTDYRVIGNEIWRDEHNNSDIIIFFSDKKFWEWFEKVYIKKEKSDIDESRFNDEDKGPKPVPTWK